MIVVEGTKSLESGTGRTQGDVTADHVNDVVGFFDLFDPIVCQGSPTRKSQEKRPGKPIGVNFPPADAVARASPWEDGA